jgi:hypothetical protein
VLGVIELYGYFCQVQNRPRQPFASIALVELASEHCINERAQFRHWADWASQTGDAAQAQADCAAAAAQKCPGAPDC